MCSLSEGFLVSSWGSDRKIIYIIYKNNNKNKNSVQKSQAKVSSQHYDDNNSLKKLHYKARPFHGQPLDGPQVQAGSPKHRRLQFDL